MATMDWLRLWHDMPNDPKWRTIARVSGQPVSLVVSMFVHLLVDASRNVTRGHADVTNEDLASALDVTEEQIQAVRDAMQGRVLEGSKLLGWDKRQPKKEDAGNPETGAKSSAERKREQRERERLKATNDSCHDVSHDVTKSHAREDKSREEKKEPTEPIGSGAGAPLIVSEGIDAKDAIWQIAVPWMIERKVPDKSARSLLGAAIKVLREKGAWELCQRMMEERPMEPAAWLSAALNAQTKISAVAAKGNGLNRQEALEQRNRQIAAQLSEEFHKGVPQ